MLRSIIRTASLLILGAAFLLPSVTTDAAECEFRERPCVANVSTSVYTGQPTIPCQQGDRVLEIVVNINCISGQGGGPNGGNKTAYRCSSDDTAIVIQDGSNTHTLQPSPGYTWGDIHTRCGKLDYTIS